MFPAKLDKLRWLTIPCLGKIRPLLSRPWSRQLRVVQRTNTTTPEQDRIAKQLLDIFEKPNDEYEYDLEPGK